MAKLTNKELEALTEQHDGRKLREDGGLIGSVRARVDGISVKWDWRYRLEGKVRQTTLGTWPKYSMPEIRSERKRLADMLSDGKDPANEKQAIKLDAKAEQVEAIANSRARIAEAEATKARLTVKELFEKWEKLTLSARKDKGAEVRRSFEKDVLPAVGDVAAEDLRRVDVARILDGVVSRGARIVARNLLGDIRQMYGFGIARGLLEIDPTSHMKRDDYGRKVERERVLAESELMALTKALPEARMAKTAELAIWVQLATCCRVGELLQAKWADVDMKARTWRIPADVAKNTHEHTIHLSDFALERVKALFALTGAKLNDKGDSVPCAWVMPARKGEGHVDLKSLTKQIGDRQRGDKEAMSNRSAHGKALILAGGKWTPHDLRRTGATMMVGLGVLPEVVERCLNHREQNRVKRIYQRHDYKKEMKAAWQLLGERITALLAVKNAAKIVALQSQKRRA
jgi:integrase